MIYENHMAVLVDIDLENDISLNKLMTMYANKITQYCLSDTRNGKYMSLMKPLDQSKRAIINIHNCFNEKKELYQRLEDKLK